MSGSVVRFTRSCAALLLAVFLAAHIGSPDVYFAGKAGPYDVDVAVRPPNVVPGIAEIFVKTDSLATSVNVRPVFWRAGSKGAPTGDEARPVGGAPGSFTGELWLMAAGAYSVNITVTGPKGSGMVVVPVASVATGQLALSPFLKVLLGILGVLLVSGVITAIHAALGESQVPPGESIPPGLRRSARRGAIIAVPALALLLFGGARWWQAEADAYRRTLYRPLVTRTVVSDSSGEPRITLTITDSNWRAGVSTPVMEDHGHPAHMFIARADSSGVLAHLHPSMPDGSTFTSALPPLPAGAYRVFVDLVQESGFQRTLVDSFTLALPTDSSGVARLGRDDAWSMHPAMPVGQRSGIVGHGDSLVTWWSGPREVRANQPGVVRLGMSNIRSQPVRLQPYLGMTGHAIVMRDDGKVFVHLHPSGTASMASQLAFALRDRGDTTAAGRLRLENDPAHEMAMSATTPVREINFPYAFPSPGHYRVWFQVRYNGEVHTSAFTLTVSS